MHFHNEIEIYFTQIEREQGSSMNSVSFVWHGPLSTSSLVQMIA